MIVLLGGAFNPPTIAHKEIIKELNSQFVIEEIIIMPTFISSSKKLIDFKHRVKMLKTMFKKQKNVRISEYERLETFRGTYFTLLDLEKKYNEKPYLVIGADNLIDIPNWINAKKLLEEFPLIVFNRDRLLNYNKVKKFMDDNNAKVSFFDLKVDVSSTKVRNSLEENKEMLTPEIYKYLKKKKLIGNN